MTTERVCCDILHDIDLGLLQKFIGKVLWSCLDANIYGIRRRTAEERRAATILIFRRVARKYYMAAHRDNPLRKQS